MTGLALRKVDQEIVSRKSAILNALAKAASEGTVVTSEAGLKTFETDALTAYSGVPLGVVLPRSTEEVSRIVKACAAAGVKVLARGAGTSLCGGAIPGEDTVVIGLSRMNRVLNVDFPNRVATVEAGITNLAVSGAVAAAKFFYAPDPSSQLACSIGGNIAMNSGGAHCLKYGVTTNNVLALKMVLADGEIVEFGGDYLDGQGLDFLGYVIGSEGQFGIVTEATVRILRQPEGQRPLMIGFATSEEAGACVAAIIGEGLIPVAIEFMDKPAIHVCENFAKAGYPLDVEAMLIVEVEGSEAEIADQLDRIRGIAQRFNPKTLKVAASSDQAAAIWKGRKAAFGAIGRISDYLCMDGVIPLGKLAEVLEKTAEIGDRHRLKIANIFHAGDGNLHPLILYNANDASEKQRAEDCGADILRLCVDVGGCLTGEHGVGIEKRDLMTYQYTPVELAQQMRVKAAFDPAWMLNPGKVFPLDLEAQMQPRSPVHG
jgi:glycolate oxidase